MANSNYGPTDCNTLRFIRQLREIVEDFCSRCQPMGFDKEKRSCMNCELYEIAKVIDE